MSTTVYTPDTAMPVIHVVDSLEEAGLVPDRGALATTQTAVVPIPGQRAFLGVGFDDPTVTRFDVNDHGVPIETVRISAANYGVTFLYKPTVVGENDVWFLSSGAGLTLFRLDIEKMEFAEVLDFDELEDDAYAYNAFSSATLRGDTLFLTAIYEDWEAGRLKPGVTVVALNVNSGTFEVSTDDRCALGELAKVGDEVLVAASHPVATGYHRLGVEGIGAPCVLRIKEGETTIDSEWIRHYTDWTGDRFGGGMFPVRPELAYIRVLDESLVPPDPTQATDWSYANAWSWARVNPLTDDPAVMVDGPPSHGPVDAHRVGDEVWSFDNDSETGVSTLRRLDADGFTTGASFNGYVYGILELDE